MSQNFLIEANLIDQSPKYDFVEFQPTNTDPCFLIIERATCKVIAWEPQRDYADQIWENYKEYIAEKIAIDIELHCPKCDSYFYIYNNQHLNANVKCTRCGEKLLITDDIRELGIAIRKLEE